MRRRGTTGSWDDHLVSLRTAVQGFIFSAKILLFSSYNRILCLYNKIYLADFLKTNLTKFAVMHFIEKASKGRFFKPEKLHGNEGKGKEKKKERGEEKEEKRKKRWLHS